MSPLELGKGVSEKNALIVFCIPPPNNRCLKDNMRAPFGLLVSFRKHFKQQQRKKVFFLIFIDFRKIKFTYKLITINERLITTNDDFSMYFDISRQD